MRRAARDPVRAGLKVGLRPMKVLELPPVDPRILCVQCGRIVELQRRCYVIPTCYKCLPPPEPLKIAKLGEIKTPRT